MTQTIKLSKEELNKEYFVRGLVPEWDSKIEDFAKSSWQKRKETKIYENIPYGKNPRQVLDIILPKHVLKNAPVLLFFHGGYWRMMDKSEFSFIANTMETSNAITVLANYRLLPEYNFDQIIEDSIKALSWVFKNIGEYSGDQNNIYVCGHSAGAQLAANATVNSEKEVAGFIGISGVYDLEPIKNCFLNDIKFLNDALVSQYSAKNTVPNYDCPALFVYGDKESNEFVRQSKDQASFWNHSNNLAKCIKIKNSNHATIVEQLGSSKSEMHKLFQIFLNSKDK